MNTLYNSGLFRLPDERYHQDGSLKALCQARLHPLPFDEGEYLNYNGSIPSSRHLNHDMVSCSKGFVKRDYIFCYAANQMP